MFTVSVIGEIVALMDALFPSTVVVMVVRPGVSAVTTPCEETVAIFGCELLHVAVPGKADEGTVAGLAFLH